MKDTIPLFEEVLNKPIDDLIPIRENDNKLLLEQLGEKNVQILIENGLIDSADRLFEFKEIFNILGDGELGTAILAGVISPLANVLQITKGSIFWYMFTYGMAVAFQEIGKDILDPKKEMDFCKAFSKGISRSGQYWGTDIVLTKIFGFIGIDLKMGAIKKVLIHGVQAYIIKGDIFYNTVHSMICGKNFEGKSVWDLTIGTVTDTVKGIFS